MMSVQEDVCRFPVGVSGSLGCGGKDGRHPKRETDADGKGSFFLGCVCVWVRVYSGYMFMGVCLV